MRYGVVLPIQAAGTALDVLWDEVLEEAVAAEAAGFEAVFLPDFHQARGGSLMSPLVLGSALLQATTSLRFGTSVLAAPFHHPAHLAEAVAMLHRTSRGRFILGVGPGYVRSHFDLFGVPHHGSGHALETTLQALRQTLAGDVMDLDGPVHRGQGAVFPRARPGPGDTAGPVTSAGAQPADGAGLPGGGGAQQAGGGVQQADGGAQQADGGVQPAGGAGLPDGPAGGARNSPGPPVWIGAHGPLGIERAARFGDAWICDPQRDVDTVARLAEQYRAAAAEVKRRPVVALFRDGWVDDSADACRLRWGPHALAVHRLYYNLGTYHRELEPWVDEVQDRADFTYDRLAPGRFLVGDGAGIRSTVADWEERTGAAFLAVRLRQPGGPGHQATMEAIARFGAEVIADGTVPGGVSPA